MFVFIYSEDISDISSEDGRDVSVAVKQELVEPPHTPPAPVASSESEEEKEKSTSKQVLEKPGPEKPVFAGARLRTNSHDFSDKDVDETEDYSLRKRPVLESDSEDEDGRGVLRSHVGSSVSLVRKDNERREGKRRSVDRQRRDDGRGSYRIDMRTRRDHFDRRGEDDGRQRRVDNDDDKRRKVDADGKKETSSRYKKYVLKISFIYIDINILCLKLS